MKRSPLLRRKPLRATTGLQRRSPLRSRPKRQPLEPGEAEWKRKRPGWCECCGHFEWILHGHHVLYLQVVRREGGPLFHPDNRMDLCSVCHFRHHYASHKIPLWKVPAAARAFAVELLGEHRAAEFFARRYAP